MVRLRSLVRVLFRFAMGEEGSAVVALGGDGFPPDDSDVGFEFEDDDEDLTIDFETIYRILDEKPPDFTEVGTLRTSNFFVVIE